MQACTQWTHSDVWSQLATTPECSFKIGDRQGEKERRNGDRRAICDATRGLDPVHGVIRNWGVSDGSDGAHPFWRSHTARTEMFFADVKPHRIHMITIRKAFVVITARRGGLGRCCEETALSQKVGKASSEKHTTQSTEDDLKLFLTILSIFTYISSSLINTCDWAFYVWTSLHTCRVRTSTDCRVSRQSFLSVGRSPFNPQLLGGFTFLPTLEYRLPCAQILHHRRITIRGVSQRVVVRRRNLIFVYLGDVLWRRFYLAALVSRGQEVGFLEETRREREN